MQWNKCIAIGAIFWSGGGLAEQRPTLVAPVSTPCISSPFGPRTLPNRPQAGTYHYGIDLPAPEGSPVRAIAAGTVLRVQHNGPGGLEVLLQHAGFVAVYSHLGQIAPKFNAGGSVTIKAGEELGAVGRTGVSFGPHLYFGMWRDGQPVDPAPLLRLPLCGHRSPNPTAILADGRYPPSSTAATGDELLLTRRSSLLDDFPPIRGCRVETMVRVATSRFSVDRGGSPFGRTGIARYTCPSVTAHRN
jgi:hypothetical protein